MEISSSNPLRLLGGKYFLNWRNHVAFAVIAMITATLFDASRIGGKSSDWFLIGVFGVAVTIVSIEIFKLILKKIKRGLSVAIAVTLILVGLIRGSSIFILGSSIGLLPETDLIYRLIGGPIFVFFFYLTSSSIFEVYLNFQEQSKLLTEEKSRLEQAKETYIHDLAAFNQQQRGRVRELLSPSIWELQKKLETAENQASVEQALIQMQALNNEVVRPLSHELATFQIGNSKADSAPKEVNRIVWPKRVSLSDNIPFAFFILLASAIGFSSQTTSGDFVRGFALASLGISTAVLSLAPEKVLMRRVYLPSWFALMITTLFGFLSGILGAFLATLVGLSDGGIFYLLSGLFFAIAKLMAITYSLFKRAWGDSLGELTAVTEELRLVNSWLRQQIWLGQKSLAMELHGSVQSTLHAMAARLSRMKEVNQDELQEIVVSIRDSLAAIENEEYLAGEDFNSLLTQLQDLWEGTASINWEISQLAQEELDKKPGLARCLFEVARESVINAVKHGEATQITIEVTKTGQMVELKITNNGKLVDKSGGSGEKLFAQVCHSHSIATNGAEVVFSAELALSL